MEYQTILAVNIDNCRTKAIKTAITATQDRNYSSVVQYSQYVR